jgi:hypothetical protein
MAADESFGRRRGHEPIQAGAGYVAAGLSPEAEAFRATMTSGPTDGAPDFADWRRAQQPRRLFAWLLTFALLSPGLLCFLFQAPLSISIGLEGAGLAINAWLRRERRRHLAAIARWEEPPNGA